MATGVSSTAVVSRLSTTVHTTASPTMSSQSTSTRPLATRAAWCAMTSKRPDRSQISATRVIATRKTRIGATRSTSRLRSSTSGLRGRGELPRTARTRWGRQLDLEALREPLGQGLRRARRLGLHELARHETAGVLGHVRGAGDGDVHPALGALAHGTPDGGIRARPAVDDELARLHRGVERRRQLLAPLVRQVADAGEGAADVDAVGRHAVTEPQRTEEGRHDDDPAVGAALGGRVER